MYISCLILHPGPSELVQESILLKSLSSIQWFYGKGVTKCNTQQLLYSNEIGVPWEINSLGISRKELVLSHCGMM